ncbi:MAG TPA: (deoxy)nucleoside triphosphate pyrophosphohydrolase [Pedobacter sp.]|nr:(deoxy)nucleoside triphosphate pyrophosphohydrolase [Pedobacter sp.]
MIEVACAIIVNTSRQILVTQRSAAMKLPLKMEFPGGKVEPGETPAECLLREIREELNLEIRIVAGMPANEHAYPDFSIRLIPFVCEIIGGNIILKEHLCYKWLEAKDLPRLDWAAADIPVVKNYIDLLDID